MVTVALNEASHEGVARLIRNSHERPMNLETVLPWSNGVDRAKGMPKPADQGWLYGTPYLDGMTESQRHELLWLETARDISMFITLEQTLPPLYVGYVNREGVQLPSDVYEYLMIFSKEEIVHTLMFKRFMQLAGLPQFSPPDGLYELLTRQLPALPPVHGIACTLIIEWIAELAAMHASQQDGVDPMVRKLFYEHHVDEARHIAFGRWVVESYLEQATAAEAQPFRGMIQGLMARLVPQFTYNPEIAAYLDDGYPIARDDAEKIAAVRGSAHNTALNEVRFAPLNNWLRKLGVM